MEKSSLPSPADAWIQLALIEYEQIASLGNIQTILGNAALSAPSTRSSQQTIMNNSSIGSDDPNVKYHPKILSAQIKSRNVENLLYSYSERIDDVRKTHASLKTKAEAMFADNSKHQQQHPITKLKSRPDSIEIEFTKHIELSERVIRTIVRSPASYCHGPCGLFHENGIIRTSDAKDYENTVVALASLRASVSRLKRDFGG